VNSNTKSADFADYGYSPSYGIGISTSCKDPVRAIKFLDWMCSDEAQVLNNWGIEGVHYTIKDGKRVRSAEEIKTRNTDKDYSKRTGIGVYTYPFPQRGDGQVDSTGNTYTVTTEEDFINAYNPAAKETLAAYGAKMWKDLYPKASEVQKQSWGQAWGVKIPQDSEINVQIQKCTDLVKAAVPKMVLAKPADFDGVWTQLQADLKKAGVDEAGKEFTKLLQARYELWNN
jgi:putative aldouronate transport system substrate-binding protein